MRRSLIVSVVMVSVSHSFLMGPLRFWSSAYDRTTRLITESGRRDSVQNLCCL